MNKKLLLLLTLTMFSTPVFAGNFWYSYSTPNMRSSLTSPYSIKSRTSVPRTNSEVWEAFNAGTAIATGRLNLGATPSIRTLSSGLSYLDPYIVSIDGNNYVLVKDSKDNKWTVENILGYDDTKEDLFASLKKLENDGNTSKISAKELKNANIRFVYLNSDESLALDTREKDYNLDKVLYIDMKNLRTALGNKNQDGTFGYFYVVINENGKKRAVPGRVTFEEKRELQKYIN